VTRIISLIMAASIALALVVGARDQANAGVHILNKHPKFAAKPSKPSTKTLKPPAHPQ
jgi:hypothetical protein